MSSVTKHATNVPPADVEVSVLVDVVGKISLHDEDSCDHWHPATAVHCVAEAYSYRRHLDHAMHAASTNVCHSHAPPSGNISVVASTQSPTALNEGQETDSSSVSRGSEERHTHTA
jgi:hypothetical protein